MIKVHGLKKYYGKNRGIEKVDFEIKEGEILGLIGPNGAGKTTTIRILTGFLTPDSGEAFIEDKKVPFEIDKIKENLGYIPGEVNFYGDMRVKEFLEFNRSFYKNIDINYEKEIIETLNIDVNKKIKNLSLGNKKKIAILQALVHKPKYLILDEPTSGLDPLIQQRFYSLIKKHKENGAVILFSSHILSEVEKLCDRFTMIKDGTVIKSGTIEGLKDISKKIITVWDIKLDDNLKRFKYEKQNSEKINFYVKTVELKDFLKVLLNYDFKDMEIKNPDLEDIFLDFYGE
ncbi:ABC-type multidrug transport system, ATPase component [Marinitoga piezophila KA3]|uniref:ABC-type multidrug transport system, ATPase component n=1 Tax=Marinitoga piezophila (strain DSM 14283 / JCM 11233 / KA3) TaxID=443254 RepID=H2J3E3_MARPK|nr:MULTISPECIES: ABC transporter ATP-binding protein [Marinitoga]AEX85759.1 ABC-type multidrug transport system, ATPase component [Marinitoga piezophila KA3]